MMDDTRRALPLAPVISTSMPLGEFLSLGLFRPAAVQRGFEWEPSEAEKLLADITTAFLEGFDEPETDDARDEDKEESDAPRDGALGELTASADVATELPPDKAPPPIDAYFIGSIVLGRLDAANFEIFDGYQRTTILVILLAVLRDVNTDPELTAECARLAAPMSAPRLLTPDNDDTLTAMLSDEDGARKAAKSDKRRPGADKRRRDIAKAFLNTIRPWSAEKIAAFTRFVLERVFVSLIEVRERRVGRQVFVSTNLFGKKLDPIDLLKGQLADTAATEDDAEEVIARWNAVREFSGVEFYNVVCAQDVITRRQSQSGQWPVDLAEHIAQLPQERAALDWLATLQRRAAGWKRIKHILANGGKSKIEQEIWRLRAFRWPEWHPLALLFLDTHDAAKAAGATATVNWTERLFARLHRRCMGMVLAGFGAPDQPADRKKIMARAVTQWRQEKDPTTNGRALTFNKKQRRKIDHTLTAPINDDQIYLPLMMWLEAADWRDDKPKQMKRASVEHVLPRRPIDERVDSDSFDSAQHAAQFNALGNLAVIPRDVNHQLQNAEFEEKRDVLATKCDAYWTVKSVLAHHTWDGEAIEARGAMLTARVWRELDLKPPREET